MNDLTDAFLIFVSIALLVTAALGCFYWLAFVERQPTKKAVFGQWLLVPADIADSPTERAFYEPYWHDVFMLNARHSSGVVEVLEEPRFRVEGPMYEFGDHASTPEIHRRKRGLRVVLIEAECRMKA